MLMLKDKAISVLLYLAMIILYVGSIANDDIVLCIAANQMFIFMLLFKISEKIDDK